MHNSIKSVITILGFFWYFMMMVGLSSISEKMYHFPGLLVVLLFLLLIFSVKDVSDNGVKVYELMSKTYRQLLTLCVACAVGYWMSYSKDTSNYVLVPYIVYTIIYVRNIFKDIKMKFNFTN